MNLGLRYFKKKNGTSIFAWLDASLIDLSQAILSFSKPPQINIVEKEKTDTKIVRNAFIYTTRSTLELTGLYYVTFSFLSFFFFLKKKKKKIEVLYYVTY
jgi:hypothetical protein